MVPVAGAATSAGLSRVATAVGQSVGGGAAPRPAVLQGGAAPPTSSFGPGPPPRAGAAGLPAPVVPGSAAGASDDVPAGGEAAAGKAHPAAAVAVMAVKAIGKAISGTFDTLNRGLKALDQPLGAVGGFFDSLGSIPGLSILKPLAGNLKGILESLVSFSARANPVVYEQLQIALEDTQAVVGGRFLPVMELVRDSVRAFGDVLADVLPTSEQVAEAVQGFRDTMAEWGPNLRQALHDLKPLFDTGLLGSLRTLSTVMRGVAIGVSFLTQSLAGLLHFLGLPIWQTSPTEGGSVGAAARRATIQGAEGYQNRAIEQAFMMPGQQVSPAVRTADLLDTIYSFLVARVADFQVWVGNLPANLWNHFRTQIVPWFIDFLVERIRAILPQFPRPPGIPIPPVNELPFIPGPVRDFLQGVFG